jgi:hypothetical protein
MRFLRKIVGRQHTRASGAIVQVTREILWESESATDSEVRKKEREFIRDLCATDPDIGYNVR